MGRSRNQYEKSGRGRGGESRRDRRITHLIEDASQQQALYSGFQAEEKAEVDDNDSADNDMVAGDDKSSYEMKVKVKLWEFGQNDPKKDSGSRLTRQGVAESLRVGNVFNGIVLSSETSLYISAADRVIITSYGIAGINCSWNRLKEIPFDALGRGRNQRILPYLLAANSINYGKPYKLNTAEALAAALFITGFKEDAIHIMSSFNYGAEFFRLNAVELDLYASCSSSLEVEASSRSVVNNLERKKALRETMKEKDRSGCGLSTDYSGMPEYLDEEAGDYDIEDGDSDDNVKNKCTEGMS